MCKWSILTAIASGYAGRDPQGGFCDRSVYVLYWNLYENKTKVLLCFLKLWKLKKNYVKVRKKAIEWEGGENQKMMKAIMYTWVGKERVGRYSVGDLIYRNKRKQIKTITYLLFTKSLPWVFCYDITLKWRQSAHSP